MPANQSIDSADVQKWKIRLLEHLRKRPRDNIRLEGLRDDAALKIAALQLVREQAPRLALVDFGTSLTLSWRNTLDRLAPETLSYMRQEQLVLDAEALANLGDDLPDAPGDAAGSSVQVADTEGSAE